MYGVVRAFSRIPYKVGQFFSPPNPPKIVLSDFSTCGQLVKFWDHWPNPARPSSRPHLAGAWGPSPIRPPRESWPTGQLPRPRDSPPLSPCITPEYIYLSLTGSPCDPLSAPRPGRQPTAQLHPQAPLWPPRRRWRPPHPPPPGLRLPFAPRHAPRRQLANSARPPPPGTPGNPPVPGALAPQPPGGEAPPEGVVKGVSRRASSNENRRPTGKPLGHLVPRRGRPGRDPRRRPPAPPRPAAATPGAPGTPLRYDYGYGYGYGEGRGAPAGRPLGRGWPSDRPPVVSPTSLGPSSCEHEFRSPKAAGGEWVLYGVARAFSRIPYKVGHLFSPPNPPKIVLGEFRLAANWSSLGTTGPEASPGHPRPTSRANWPRPPYPADQAPQPTGQRRGPAAGLAPPRPPVNWRATTAVAGSPSSPRPKAVGQLARRLARGSDPRGHGPGSETPLQAPGAAGPLDGRV